MMADTLVAVEDDQKTLHPLLAKSWSLSGDGLTYTFNLRDDVSFCDGKKLTAADVVYSLKRLIAPEARRPPGVFGKVSDIAAQDDTTVVYTLKEPNNELLLHLAQSFGSIIDRANVEKLGADFGVKGLNGTGPFCWAEWRPRDQFTVLRHDAYKWGPAIYDNKGIRPRSTRSSGASSPRRARSSPPCRPARATSPMSFPSGRSTS